MDEIQLYCEGNPRQTLNSCYNMLEALSGAVANLHQGANEGECLALSHMASNVHRALSRMELELWEGSNE